MYCVRYVAYIQVERSNTYLITRNFCILRTRCRHETRQPPVRSYLLFMYEIPISYGEITPITRITPASVLQHRNKSFTVLRSALFRFSRRFHTFVFCQTMLCMWQLSDECIFKSYIFRGFSVSAEVLRAMSGPDVTALAADLARAVELTMSTGASQSDRLKAYNACESFKETSPLCAEAGLFLAAGTQYSLIVRHFGLQLMEHTVKYRWNQISQQEKVFIKVNCLYFVFYLCTTF